MPSLTTQPNNRKYTLAEALARQEGYYTPGTRPNVSNNPGDIEWHPAPHGFAYLHGATGPNMAPGKYMGRFAHFPDAATGWAAMYALLRTSAYKGLTIRACLNRWAPPIENDVSAYEKNVCDWTGLKHDTIIDAYIERFLP